MGVGIVVQARMGSTRLPGKIVKPFFNNKGILQIIIEELLNKYGAEKVVLATSVSDQDEEVAELGKDLGCKVYRGSENDVLNRFIQAAEFAGFESVVRICADNPFLDYDSIEGLIDSGIKNKVDYYAYGISESHPTIKTHFGFWPEFVSVQALKRAESLTSDSFYHEHVTNYVYLNPNKFNVKLELIKEGWRNRTDIRFTVDTIEDFELQQHIYATFADRNWKRTPERLISYIDDHPKLRKRMANEVSRWEK